MLVTITYYIVVKTEMNFLFRSFMTGLTTWILFKVNMTPKGVTHFT